MHTRPHEESQRPFSLFGGPLHRLGQQLGLVRGTNTVPLGLALGGGFWLIVVALALVGGVTARLFEMSVVAGHARLLVVIPLFFICESWVGPRMTAFIGTMVRTGIVPPGETAKLDAELARTARWANSWIPEAVCLLVAAVLEVTGSSLQKYGASAVYDSTRTAIAAFVYFRIGVTLFRFLFFRWLWKLALWGWFLWRVSRLDLQLIPGHPDRDGGLGPLEGVHERFTPLVAAISVLESASLAESISSGTLAATAMYPWLSFVLIVDGVIFLGPMVVFVDKLWACRTKGVGLYTGLAARYAKEFEAKWTGNNPTARESLLGTPDIGSMGDLATVVGYVKAMRWITIGPRLIAMMTMAAVVPLAPLLLFQYPITELARKFFSRLVGF